MHKTPNLQKFVHFVVGKFQGAAHTLNNKRFQYFFIDVPTRHYLETSRNVIEYQKSPRYPSAPEESRHNTYVRIGIYLRSAVVPYIIARAVTISKSK